MEQICLACGGPVIASMCPARYLLDHSEERMEACAIVYVEQGRQAWEKWIVDNPPKSKMGQCSVEG